MRSWWEIHENDANMVLQWRAVKGFRDDIVSALKRAGDEAGGYMAQHAPFHTGQLYHAIYVTPVTYRPGGAGGGGTWEVEVGVDEHRAPHTQYVIEGTGIYAREGGGKKIWPGTYRGVFAFEKQGEIVYSKWTHGQKPQRDWFENAQELAENIIDHAIRYGVR